MALRAPWNAAVDTTSTDEAKCMDGNGNWTRMSLNRHREHIEIQHIIGILSSYTISAMLYGEDMKGSIVATPLHE